MTVGTPLFGGLFYGRFTRIDPSAVAASVVLKFPFANSHRSTRQAVEDLRSAGRLIEVSDPVDAELEMAEIQRRVYANHGPAVLFTNVVRCRFPMVSNLFGSIEQARYLFRHTLPSVRKLIQLKIDPTQALKHPIRYAAAPFAALTTLPKWVKRGAVLQSQCNLDELPALKSWPDDGGPFITLPQVLSADPRDPVNLMKVNLGMYRVQLGGNEYQANREIGLHYQIHRGIGIHHRAAMDQGVPLQVAITVGGAPAMTLAAVMPLPEGLSELTFAGALSGRRVPMIRGQHAPVYADADFAIVGEVYSDQTKPEGPFGDHLGYYSLQHPFPLMKVKHVWHRRDAVWPFTVVGRPPQEDTTFGQLIHELTDSVIPTVIPGVKSVHAVDAAGVHPLLLAIGTERYMPHLNVCEPQELLTQANAILGNGQLSLAKYLFITEDPRDELDIHNLPQFFDYLLQRFDPTRDLHFQTRTTIDTLDYSGSGFNKGSKLVIAARSVALRRLATAVPSSLTLPSGFTEPRLVLPGILAVKAPPFLSDASHNDLRRFCEQISGDTNHRHLESMPLITFVDDSEFVSRQLANWLWVTFTRSNPAVDLDGIGAVHSFKHWGCRGPVVIDARIKPHHAPPLVEDAEVTRKVDALAARGTAISRYL